MLFENALAMWVDLTVENDVEARSLETEIETTDTGEEGSESHSMTPQKSFVETYDTMA